MDRWEAFRAGREFLPFTPRKSDDQLQKEFELIHKTRLQLWTTPGYERAAIVPRSAPCAAFAYNQTVPYYNASTVWLKDRPYIACEGPKPADVPLFFRLLSEKQVTHIVRLTDAYEEGKEKCAPYWEQPPSIPTFAMPYWKDNQGVEPEKLLSVALEVKQQTGLFAVHCSAGVGRTGTFLAALALLDAIDQKEPFSIEEIVYRLSIQRAYSVGQASQYITLHRLAELYEKGTL